MKHILWILALAIIPAGFSGCGWLVVGGAGGEAGYIASQDNRTSDEILEDQWLFTKVKAALATTSNLSSGNIEVTVRKRVVTLKGVLPSHQEKMQAIAAAKSVEGVKKVVVKLSVGK
jgi:osmotically-inducible protein OsmY